MNEIKVWYYDQIFEVIDKISSELREFGLEIVSDELEHDGFEVYKIKKIDG